MNKHEYFYFYPPPPPPHQAPPLMPIDYFRVDVVYIIIMIIVSPVLYVCTRGILCFSHRYAPTVSTFYG